MTISKISRKPIQDRFIANLWIEEAVNRGKKYGSGMVAYYNFTEKMIQKKYRIELWHLEIIGEKFNFKPAWAEIKYKLLLQQHK